jgi:hypothetical protein
VIKRIPPPPEPPDPYEFDEMYNALIGGDDHILQRPTVKQPPIPVYDFEALAKQLTKLSKKMMK